MLPAARAAARIAATRRPRGRRVERGLYPRGDGDVHTAVRREKYPGRFNKAVLGARGALTS